MSEFGYVVVDVWSDFAMFTKPESKVERTTYDIPTPSACRGVLNAIYSKPIEFYYEITKIEVMKPIRKIVMKKNELKVKANERKVFEAGYYIDIDENHTQRVSSYLCDVYYRIHAKLVKRDDAPASVNVVSLVNQFNRRVEYGKCFYQPYLGSHECMCHFAPVNVNMKPLNMNKNFGIVLYDVFDITDNKPLDTRKKTQNLCTVPTFFNADMQNGIIKVPGWFSDEIFRRR